MYGPRASFVKSASVNETFVVMNKYIWSIQTHWFSYKYIRLCRYNLFKHTLRDTVGTGIGWSLAVDPLLKLAAVLMVPSRSD
jgi:hypothetical protein